jgi:hypothetical protein
MFDSLAAEPEVDTERIVLVGRSFGGVIAPRGAAGEHRLAALIVDPGQFDMGPPLLARLGPLADHVHDPRGRLCLSTVARSPRHEGAARATHDHSGCTASMPKSSCAGSARRPTNRRALR